VSGDAWPVTDDHGFGGCGDLDQAEPLLIDYPLDYQGDYGPLRASPAAGSRDPRTSAGPSRPSSRAR
jgi:hypothetical protein